MPLRLSIRVSLLLLRREVLMRHAVADARRAPFSFSLLLLARCLHATLLMPMLRHTPHAMLIQAAARLIRHYAASPRYAGAISPASHAAIACRRAS